MGEIARRSRLSKQTMTTMVRLCERDGLVRRERDPQDARAFRIHLTARGRRFRPVATRVAARVEGRVVRALGRAETEGLRRNLKEIVEQ